MKFGKKEAILAAGLAVGGSSANAAETPKDLENPNHQIEMTSPVDKTEKKDSLTFNYESHRMDSLIMEKLGNKAMYFGAEDLDSTAHVNKAEISMDYTVNLADLEKELARPSSIEGKTVKEALESGDYVAFLVPNEINGDKVDYDGIKDLFGIKHVKGENVGNQGEKTQSRVVFPGLHIVALPTNDSANFAEQLKNKPSRQHTVADFNEVMFAIQAFVQKLKDKEVSGRISETSKVSSDFSRTITLANKYVVRVDKDGNVSVEGWDNSIREEGTGMWYSIEIDNE